MVTFDIYLVNVKTIRRMAQIFEAFSEKLNFKVLQRTPARLSYTDISTYCATIQTLDCATFHITYCEETKTASDSLCRVFLIALT